MRNDRGAKTAIQDAEIILDEAHISFKSGYYHRVVRKCQESTELAVKGLFRYLGLEYPKSHILGRIIKKELSKLGLFNREELDKLAYISDTLAFDREPAFYGSPEGIPASELYDKEDAAEALEGTLWAINMVKRATK